jgi:hypothetical protein
MLRDLVQRIEHARPHDVPDPAVASEVHACSGQQRKSDLGNVLTEDYVANSVAGTHSQPISRGK